MRVLCCMAIRCLFQVLGAGRCVRSLLRLKGLVGKLAQHFSSDPSEKKS